MTNKEKIRKKVFDFYTDGYADKVNKRILEWLSMDLIMDIVNGWDDNILKDEYKYLIKHKLIKK